MKPNPFYFSKEEERILDTAKTALSTLGDGSDGVALNVIAQCLAELGNEGATDFFSKEIQRRGVETSNIFRARIPTWIAALTANRVEPFPLKKLSEIQSKPVSWLVDGLLPGNSLSLISGSPKVGKSFLTLEFALTVASGGKGFGCRESMPGKVLLFNAEDDPARVTKPRIEAMAKGKQIENLDDLPFYFIDAPNLHIDDSKDQTRLLKLMETERPSLIVLDPMRNLYTGDENSSQEVLPVLEALRQLQRVHGTAVLIVSHDRKTGDSAAVGSRVRGSSAIFGFFDWVLFLDRFGEDFKITSDGRIGRPIEPFSFRIEDGLLRYSGEMRASQEHVEILGLLAKNGPMTRSTIADLIKKRDETVRWRLNELLNLKKVKNEDKKWALIS